ncbi:MAG: serine/threonine-protein kinase [Myxococcota bacterium]
MNSEFDESQDLVETRTGATPSARKGSRRRSDALVPGMPLGRYTILTTIGAGGMGVVYAAYDPNLDRKVAIKVLGSEDSDAAARARLVREGQALARLTHPNVVTVHEVGEVDGRVFLAMEYVRGSSLLEWLAERPDPATRRKDGIADLLLQAGAGLEAAHRAGLIHRDFKPGNVMVGDDGRARVVDFGLARAAENEGIPFVTISNSEPRSPGSGELTATGKVVGSLKYMAPEQYAGERLDARCDQFSFCLVVHEALAGVYPFTGRTPFELREAMEERSIEPPSAVDMPASLWKAVERGCAWKPARRFSSLEPILDELRAFAGIQRIRDRPIWRVAAVSLVVAGAVALGSRVAATDEGPTCDDGVSQLEVAWGADQRAKVEAALSKPELNVSEDSTARVVAALDDYGRRWAEVYDDSCRATWHRGEQSSAMLDLRSRCLRKARAGFGTVAELLGDADASLAGGLDTLLESLPSLQRCVSETELAAIRQLDERYPPPPQIDEWEQKLARANVLTVAARDSEAEALWAEIEAGLQTQPYLPVEVSMRSARLFPIAMDRSAKARTELEETFAAALETDQVSIAMEVAALGVVRSIQIDERSQAEFWMRLATSLMQRIDDPMEHIRMGFIQGWLASTEARYDDAKEHFNRVLKLTDEHPYPDYRSQAQQGLARILRSEGALVEAEAMAKAALETIRSSYAPNQQIVAQQLMALGSVAHDAGRHDEALAYRQEAVKLFREHGRGGMNLCLALASLGDSFLVLGSYPEAHAAYTEARDEAAVTNGPDTELVALSNVGLGQVLFEQGQLDESWSNLQTASRQYEAAVGLEHPALVTLHLSEGATLLELGRFEDAVRKYERVNELAEEADYKTELVLGHQGLGLVYERKGELPRATDSLQTSLAVLEKIGSGGPGVILGTRRALGVVLSKRGEWAKAVEVLEPLVAMHVEQDNDPGELTLARGLLGWALINAGRDESRGRALLDEALKAREGLKLPVQPMAAFEWLVAAQRERTEP